LPDRSVDRNPRLLVAEALRIRDYARRTGLPAAFEQAAQLLRDAVRGTPEGDPGRPGLLNDLGAILTEQFERTGRGELIEESAQAHEASLASLPEGHADRPMYLVNLSITLRVKYGFTRDPRDLNRLIKAAQEAAGLLSRRDKVRASALSSLSAGLRIRGEGTADLADLNAAVSAGREAISAARRRDHRQYEYRSVLALALLARFERTGDLADADAAISLASTVAADPRNARDKANALSNLSHAHYARFEQTRDLADAAAAIDAARAAVDATPPDHPSYPRFLSNLGGPLRARYEQVGEIADLDEAIRALREAGAPADGHPLAAAFAGNLAGLLHYRFRAVGELADIDEAVEASRATVRLAIAGRLTEYIALAQAVLCGVLHARHQHTQQPADVDEAIAAGREAVRGLPPDHPMQAYAKHALSLVYLARYLSHGRNANDLTEAITLAEAALAVAPPGHPNRVGYLSNLATCLLGRWEATGDAGDLADAFALKREAVATSSGPARHRVDAAVLLGSTAAELGAMAEAEDAYAQAVALLPLEAWHGLSQRARQEFLAHRSGLASDAAACAIAAGHPEHAVVLLEQGRSVLWSQALRLRGGLDELRRAQPRLARRLSAARSVLDSVASPDPATEALAPGRGHRDEARIRAADDWDRVLAEVRAIPEFASFLEPPAFAELAAGTGAGPVVVINVSQFRCDALVVAPAGVLVVPLPALTRGTAVERAERYRQTLAEIMGSGWTHCAGQVIDDTLGWLWEAVTGPVLTALELTAQPADSDQWPRVWWCPTGPLAALPLHAAGLHPARGDDSVRPSATVMDRVISSYTPSLRSLHRARATAPPRQGTRPRVLLVTMPTTPGLASTANLPGAEREADIVTAAFPGSCTVRTGQAATGPTVLADLDGHAFAHFACHGAIDLTRPEKSGLVLADGLLTIADLSRHELPPAAAQLAYLSACSTGYVSDTLPDEAITIAAGLQLAGFRHVIGTFWEVSDLVAPRVAEGFYRQLAVALPAHDPAGAVGIQAADALHAAIRRLRRDGRHPAHWAPFFHAGP
jgi:hypothetical protein